MFRRRRRRGAGEEAGRPAAGRPDEARVEEGAETLAGTESDADVRSRSRGDEHVTVVDRANFEQTTSGGYTIVDFWASWCAPCRTFAPAFHDVAARYGDRIRFGSCNVEDNPAIAQLLQISSIPTLVLFDPSGSEAGRVVGAPGKPAFEQMVREVVERVEREA